MKRTLSLVLALMLCLSCCAALPGLAEAQDAALDPVEITWMIPTQQSISLGDSIPVKTLLEKFNVQVNWIELPPTDQHPEKMNLLIAARQIPEILSWVNADVAAQYGNDGAFLELTPYLASHFPALSKVIAENEASRYAAFTSDEKLWFVPTWERTAPPNWGFSVVKSQFEGIGFEDGGTFEDYYQALVKLKEQNPESTPLLAREKEYGVANFLGSFIIPFTHGKAGTWTPVGFDYDAKAWKLSVSIDGYREAVEFARKLYAEGLLHPEYMTTDMNTLVSQFAQGQGYATVDYVGGLSGVGDVQSQIGDANELVPIQWPSPDGEPSIMGSKAVAFDARGTVFPATLAEDPEKLSRVLGMIDFLYTDEWYDIFYNNPDILAEDGVSYIDDYYARRDNLRDLYFPWAMFATFQNDPLRVDVQPGTPWADFCIKWSGEWQDRLTDPVIMPFDTDTQTQVNELSTEVMDYWTANIEQFVIGRSDMAEWDGFVQELMNRGGAELEEIYNRVYQEFYGA